jgi:adenylate cyclase
MGRRWPEASADAKNIAGMRLRDRTKLKLKRIILFGPIGAMIGGLYSELKQPTLHNLCSGIFVGVGISVGLVASEVFFLRAWMKRKSFTAAVLLSTVYYLMVVICILFISSTLFEERGAWSLRFRQFWASPDTPTNILFSVLISFFFALSFHVNELIGGRIFFSFFTGKYHKPVEEDRIFMFLDLKSSTSIAERIGHVKFHKFMNDFLFMISEAIMANKGEIYKYVGDGIIITWPLKEGLKDGRCLRLFFEAVDRVKEERNLFEKEYGTVPEFKVGMHCGKVVSGEMGDTKKEIAFLGDVINTTARIEEECNPHQRALLISSDLLQKIDRGNEYRYERIGNIHLRGKMEEIELYAVERSS